MKVNYRSRFSSAVPYIPPPFVEGDGGGASLRSLHVGLVGAGLAVTAAVAASSGGLLANGEGGSGGLRLRVLVVVLRLVGQELYAHALDVRAVEVLRVLLALSADAEVESAQAVWHHLVALLQQFLNAEREALDDAHDHVLREDAAVLLYVLGHVECVERVDFVVPHASVGLPEARTLLVLRLILLDVVLYLSSFYSLLPLP